MLIGHLIGSGRCGTPEGVCQLTRRLSLRLSLQVLEMTTTWGGGVEAAAVALATEGGEAEAEEWVASEMGHLAEERQTSENRRKRSVHSGLACS